MEQTNTPNTPNKLKDKVRKHLASVVVLLVAATVIFCIVIDSRRGAEAARAEAARVAARVAEVKKIREEFTSNKSKIMQSIRKNVKAKDLWTALGTCKNYKAVEDTDFHTVCGKVLDAVRKQDDAKKEAEERKAKAKADAELKKTMGPRAWRLHKKYPHWSLEDCENVAKGYYWIGMTLGMLKAQRGLPNSANPSNYGGGVQWQWCWYDYTPRCFYDEDNDGRIDSYN